MNNDLILRSYLNNVDQMSVSKQFHFWARLYLWFNHPQSQKALERLKPKYLGQNTQQYKSSLKQKLSSQEKYDYNCPKLRAPVLAKYPQITNLNNALFKCLYAQTIYETDIRPIFLELVDESKLTGLQTQLVSNPKDVSILSTIAINFLYLTKKFLKHQDTAEILNLAESVWKSEYDLENSNELILAVYLLTHCVIGETLFYAFPPDNNNQLKELMTSLTEVITSHYFELHLDVKIEYLVCCQICGINSSLEKIILNEAENSLVKSKKGYFLKDKYTANPQTYRTDLISSEHRNILYLMAVSKNKN